MSSRYGRYYRNRSTGMGLSIFIFVIILAIATGYAGTKYIVFPYLLENNTSNSNTENAQNAEENTSGAGVDVITSLPSIILDQQNIKDLPSKSDVETVSTTDSDAANITNNINQGVQGPFSVQFGSFSTKSGAETLSSELTQKGIYSYIYETGDGHKVLGLPYSHKEKALEAVKIVSSAVPDVFVVDMSTLIK